MLLFAGGEGKQSSCCWTWREMPARHPAFPGGTDADTLQKEGPLDVPLMDKGLKGPFQQNLGLGALMKGAQPETAITRGEGGWHLVHLLPHRGDPCPGAHPTNAAKGSPLLPELCRPRASPSAGELLKDPALKTVE